jgi:hypothetical protein
MGEALRPMDEGVDGLAALHALITEQLVEDVGPLQVVVGIETDRRLWVQALIAAGYTRHPLRPARHRLRRRSRPRS